jgi:hypothetical protein
MVELPIPVLSKFEEAVALVERDFPEAALPAQGRSACLRKHAHLERGQACWRFTTVIAVADPLVTTTAIYFPDSEHCYLVSVAEDAALAIDELEGLPHLDPQARAQALRWIRGA